LNIPLGVKVTSHAVGNALLTKVNPAVETFSPDIIILSAGFDAHKNDPMGLGALSAEDFAHITEATCQLAVKSCSGRVVSVLEGGYGVPCCCPQGERDELLRNDEDNKVPPDKTVLSENKCASEEKASSSPERIASNVLRPQPSKLADLGKFLPENMKDQVSLSLQRKLERCHDEGFIDCVREHVASLAKCSARNEA